MFVPHPTARRRRGTVLVMVIGVLAMLFIIGSTLLIVSRFERDNVQQKTTSVQRLDTSEGILFPILSELRKDIVGNDNIAYNGGWSGTGGPNRGDEYAGENFADFAGWISNPHPSGDARIRKRMGDMLFASVAPFTDGTAWYFFSTTWLRDAYTQSDFSLSTQPTRSDMPLQPLAFTPPAGDADGDGIVDSVNLSTDGRYALYARVVPHGGMVTLDPLTHPALLAQILHPSDLTSVNDAEQLRRFVADLGIDPELDEYRLRRRGSLPENVAADLLPLTDWRRRLPTTLGLKDRGQNPHWKQYQLDVPTDLNYWKERLTPATPRTAALYSQNTDYYDRRHLITTVSYDDVLRPQRDEARLGPLNNNTTLFYTDPGSPTASPPILPLALYYVLNPSATPGTVTVNGVDYPTQPKEAYGIVGEELVFNKPGMRSAFSLRDVLGPPEDPAKPAQASYTRAVQLMAYYLAMIQRTTVPGTSVNVPNVLPGDPELAHQLRLAAQLAVNTIDFADSADANGDGLLDAKDLVVDASMVPIDPHTALAWPPNNPVFEVIGFEKQPFITEIYAKVVVNYMAPGTPNPAITDAESIWAVELYNPYAVPISLRGYTLSIDTVTPPRDLGELLTTARGDGFMKPGERIVFSNIATDPNDANNHPFTTAASNGVIAVGDLKIDPDNPVVELRRKRSYVLQLRPDGPPEPGSDTESIVVDRLGPDDAVPALGYPWDPRTPAVGNGPTEKAAAHFAQLPDPTLPPPDGLGLALPTLNTNYWRHTSIQRHKEPFPASPRSNENPAPIYWHFTLARAKAFESEIQTASQPGVGAVHDMLGYGRDPMTTPPPGLIRYVSETDPDWFHLWTGTAQTGSVAPVPLLTADLGIDPLTGACRAFPTTGTLLLVSRYAHMRIFGESEVEERPITWATAHLPYESLPARGVADAEPDAIAKRTLLQLQQVDNGHLPVVDPAEVCLDFDGNDPEGQADFPWGQLVTSYFTALPLTELTSPKLAELSDEQLKWQYAGIDHLPVWSVASDRPSYPGIPFVERVATPAGVTFGPRVRGRVNVNFAPWWVLDGLPVIPDKFDVTMAGTIHALPIPELYSDRLDPAWLPSAQARLGATFVKTLMDESTTGTAVGPFNSPPPFALDSVSPYLAKAIVSYRERRHITEGNANILEALPEYHGLLTVGSLVNVINSTTFEINAGQRGRLLALRDATNQSNPQEKPYAYLGYLQLVTPLVRLQDWATVKSHVFTIYTLVGDPGDQTDPSDDVWLRAQATVDRTRCLYSNDLPAIITETPPISYYNVINDQR